MPTVQQLPQHAQQQQQQQQFANEANNGVSEVTLEENDMPNLSTLSLDELKQLDRDPEFFDDFIEELSVVQHLNKELDSMMNQVETISRKLRRAIIRKSSKNLHTYIQVKTKARDHIWWSWSGGLAMTTRRWKHLVKNVTSWIRSTWKNRRNMRHSTSG